MLPKSKQLKILIIIIIVSFIPFFLYYFFYISSQKRYFTQRNFRLLSGISNQISLKIENLGVALHNAIGVELYNAIKRGDVIQNNELLAHIPDLELVDEPCVLSEVSQSEDTSRRDRSKLAPETKISIKQEWNTFWLYFDYTGSIHGVPFINVRVKSDLNKLIKPFVNYDIFDEVLVAQQKDGSVIFQRQPSALKITSLKTLKDVEGKEIKFDAFNPPASFYNSRFHMYAQPLQMSSGSRLKENLPDGQETVQWIVLGMIRSDRFNSECMTISSNYLIKIIFFAIIMALSWPLFKLLLMGPRDRLGMSDVLFLGFSLLMVSAFLSFAIADAYSYFNLRDKLDKQLIKFSETIQKNFHEEIKCINNELKKLNNKNNTLIDDINKIKDKENKTIGETNIFQKENFLSQDSHPYPYYTKAIWIDNRGQQRIKWTIEDRTTPFIDVSAREYFRKPREDWPIDDKGDTSNIWLEPIYSWNTGENTSTISCFSSIDDTTTRWVTSVDTRLLSLYQTTLPPGFGYCVIDETGKVLFHSDEIKNLRQNFFDECDKKHVLRAAVFGHVFYKCFNIQYEGKDHRLCVCPLNYSNFQGYLIVFLSKELTRAANLEILTISAIFFMLLLLIPIVIFFGVCLFKLTYRMFTGKKLWHTFALRSFIHLMWPKESWGRKYAQTSYLNLFLCIVLFCVILLDWHIVICTFFTYLLGPFLIYFILKEDKVASKVNKFSETFKRHHKAGYMLVAVSSLTLLAVLPSWAFFKFAYDEEMKLFVKHGQIKLASSLEARQDRLISQYLKIHFKEEIEKKEFLRKRLDFKNWDIYHQFFFNTNIDFKSDAACIPSVGNSFLNDFLYKIRPHYKQVCDEINGLINNVSVDNVWHWEEDSGKFVFHKNGYKNVDKKESVLHISSLVPALGVPKNPIWWILLLFLLLILFFMVRFVLQRVFLFDVDVPSNIHDEGLKEGLSYLILGTSCALKEFPSHCSIIDLRKKARKEEWLTDFMSEEYLDNQEAVRIENFDYRWSDPRHNLEKLQLLEKLIMHNKIVIIVSSVHPDNYNFSSSGNDSPQAKPETSPGKQGDVLPANVMEHWNSIFKSMPIIHVQEQGGGEPHKEQRYYHDLWNTFSHSEKFTLYYLAKDGFISAGNPDISQLVKRNIISFERGLCIKDDKFHKFILTTSLPKDIVAWKKEGRSIWNSTKGPFIYALIGGALFVFVTQREVFNSTIAIVSAFTAALPAVFKLFGLFQTGKPDNAPEG